jgi:MoaA/NifB/PqqE/SkfB family radical SAM enzyme
MKKLSKTFCWRPFTELYVNLHQQTHAPCCVFYPKIKGVDLIDPNKDIRNATLNEEWHSGCSSCKNNNNKNSHRLQYFGHRDTQLVIDNISAVYSIEIALSNTCNLACITCNEKSSTRWASENARMSGLEGLKSRKPELSYIFNLDIWKNVKTLKLYGGEPMYIKETPVILNWLIDHGIAENIMLEFYTNGTVYNESIANLLSKFKSVRIGFSVDGVKDRYEVIRWPAIWSELVENFKKISTLPNVESHIIYTYSILNAYNVIDDFDIIRSELTDNISVNFVSFPDYYAARNIPEDDKKDLINAYRDDIIASKLINDISQLGSVELYETAIKQLKHLDRWRNTDSSILMPT